MSVGHSRDEDSAEWQYLQEDSQSVAAAAAAGEQFLYDSFSELARRNVHNLPIAETINLADHVDVEHFPFGGLPLESSDAAAAAAVSNNNATTRIQDILSNPAAMDSLMNGNAEAILAREMAKLSVSEREEVLHDIHGVTDDIVEETPQLIHQKLLEMEVNISDIQAAHQSGPTAYSMAKSMSPEFVQDFSLRLMFLRASHFDVEQAARRFWGHFEKKLELFGPSKLTKTITMDDLDIDDKVCLTSGQSQLLPYRDRSGRAIFFQALSHYRFKQVINAMRVIYYILMAAVDDEETQKRGVVCVVYNVEPKSSLANDPRIYLNVYQLLPTLPIRMMGAHYCVQDANLRQFMSSIRVAMSREVRLRSRVHHGSHEECIYALMTFGIPRKSFPISNSGELLIEKHAEFLAMRRKQEATQTTITVTAGGIQIPQRPQQAIVVPKNADVLLGRGRPFQEHTGNMRCNFVVMAAMEEYERVSRNDKTGIARDVIAKIKDYGGRFLKQNDGVWEEVDDSEALRKISHSFRTHRQLLKVHQSSEDKEPGILRRSNAGSDLVDTCNTKRTKDGN